MHFEFQLWISINCAQDWNSRGSLLFEMLDYGHRVTKFGVYWDKVDSVVALMLSYLET